MKHHASVAVSLLKKAAHLQVLNMKPQEILGMLEEAAGTRMCETEKDASARACAPVALMQSAAS